MVWVVVVTWYISYAGVSWNLFGECSFDLFTACKQAFLVVLTVNVLVVFLILWCYKTIFFSFSRLCSVGKSSTNLWVAGPHIKLVQTLIDSVLFFIKCLLSVMNVFISGPALTSAKTKNMLSVWDWGGGRTPFCFVLFCLFLFLFWGFQAENQKWDTKHSH